MHNPISRTPFLFLLIPLILGILLQYYGLNRLWSIIAVFLGSAIVLLSFFIKKRQEYNLRWIFGVGVFFLFVAFGGATTYSKQQSLEYVFSDGVETYIGYVAETPQYKPRSIAYKIHLEKEDVNVVCYFEKDTTQLPLGVGNELVFMAQLQPFKNAGNPDDFDYERYMYNQGFVANVYLTNNSWIATGKSKSSLKILALKVRQKIMDFYQSLDFEGDELAVLSALTLGCQDTVSDDLMQGFRTTGTVHILSVSGLHTMIIFSILSFALSFISRSSRFYRIRPILIILLLWMYAFVTGLPPSVVRASAMLTVFCMADLFGNRKHSSLNGLYIAGFCMLFYNPFWIFDIGFQLSFLSVLSILILHHRMSRMLIVQNRFLKPVWQMFCLSIVAQLATFPLCLYYFGTFPTYFFIANLVIVPLVTVITYGIGVIALSWVVSLFIPMYSDVIYWLPVHIVKLLLKGMNFIVEFWQYLPFALIQDVNLSFIQLVLLVAIIITLLFACIKYSSKSLIISLVLMVSLVLLVLKDDLTEQENQLIVYNRNGSTDIRVNAKGDLCSLDSVVTNLTNPVVVFGDDKLLILNAVLDDSLEAKEQYIVDCIVVTGNANYSLNSIEERYNTSKIILDGSLKMPVRKQLTKECENRNILLYDVTKKGAFSLKF